MKDFVGTPQFPILYEDEDVRIYTNSSKELFVENKHQPSCTVRLSGFNAAGLMITAHDCYLSPWSKNGLPAFGVIPKR